MYGAIIGDVIGSRFEFDNCKSKEFDLFDRECDYTDDTVMTLAVAKALTTFEYVADMEAFKRHLVATMHEVGQRYPHCGYGGRFCTWMMKGHTEPYNSYGNGSAMRVSPVAWVAHTLEECEALARATAEVTHNHPEGIKGAVATAGAIYLARTGHEKELIRRYTDRYYPIDFTLDDIRGDYDFDETCPGSMPQALAAFFEADGFEDTIRTAVSVGGDSDTIAAIAGSIAEAYYGVDKEMKETALSYLDDYLLTIAEEFGARFKLRREIRMSEKKNNITELVFILDRSGSMAGLESDTIGGFNALLDKQKKLDEPCYVSTVLFDDTTEVIHDREKIADVPPLTDKEYYVRGCTALLDAVGGAIHHIGRLHKYLGVNAPAHTLFVITTDGMENASRRYGAERVKQMIQRQKEQYGWEFLFIGANIDAVQTAARYGIGADRAVNYHADAEGTAVVYRSVEKAVRQVRACAPLGDDWSNDIREDYCNRNKK